MSVNLSALAGAGQQFFDNNGNPLSGGKLWSYQAGTTTPQTTYTTAAGNVAHTNPIILDAGGRVATGEIWLTAGSNYKFVLMTSADVTLVTWDNITGINGTGITSNAVSVEYDPPFAGALTSGYTVEDKLAQTVSVKDFGAVGDGVTDDTAAIVAALATGEDVMLPDGTYKLSPSAVQTIANQGYQRLFGEGNVTLSVNLASSIDLFVFDGPVALENLTIDFNNSYCKYAFRWAANAGHICIKNVRLQNFKDIDSSTGSITFYITPTGNTFDVEDVKASSMLKRGNGTVTDSAGSYNMIYVGGGSGGTQGSINNVFVSEIHNINASDQIIYEDTSVIYIITDTSDQNNRIKIGNIYGYNFGKRLLKIHASNVTVDSVTGISPEGDSLGVIGFLSGEGQGDKYGQSASNVRALGKMEVAFASSSPSTSWNNLVASIQPGTKAGMSNAAVSLFVASNGTTVDGFWSDSQRDIAVGTSVRIVTNTVLRNITLVLNSTKTAFQTIYNRSDTLGFDGLLIDGLYATVSSDATSTTPVYLWDFTNGTTKKGRNLTIKNVVIQTDGPLNSQGIMSRYNENVTIQSVKYINTSGLSHFRILEITSCSNVNIDDVVIEGVNQTGVLISLCTGQNTIGRVYNSDASTAVVSNNNSTDVWVYGCDQTKVVSVTTAAPQNSKQTSGTTANRPTTGLVAGYSQHFDTTLGKPIWWNGSVWKDATGATV